MKDALMMAVQITPEERDRFKNLARSKGMLMQGYLAALVRRELRDSSGPEIKPTPFSGTGARDSAL